MKMTAQDRPKTPQDRPKTDQDRTKTTQHHQDRPETALRPPQDGPRSPQDRPKTAQDRPKTAQDRPKTTPRRPKPAPRPPQDRQRPPQDHSRPPKTGPRPLQDRPKTASRRPTKPQSLQAFRLPSTNRRGAAGRGVAFRSGRSPPRVGRVKTTLAKLGFPELPVLESSSLNPSQGPRLSRRPLAGPSPAPRPEFILETLFRYKNRSKF